MSNPADVYEETTKSGDSYFRCRNCGTWIERGEAYREFYCCFPCSIQYRRCAVCGRYFPEGEGISGDICSPECGTGFTTDMEPLEDGEIVSGSMDTESP
jgi:hypothetical protein